MNNIYLVGFMGTGKSSAGRRLAEKISRKFVDLDGSIEKREKRKISDIFANDSEAYFRKIEKQTLIEVSGGQEVIVACGGGIVIDPENIRIMKQTGKIICLTAMPEVILKRIRGNRRRPLLNMDNPAQKIEELLGKRAQFYARADETVDTSELSIEQVADKVVKIIQC